MSLKALAELINRRDSERDNYGTSDANLVPGGVREKSAFGTAVPVGQTAGQPVDASPDDTTKTTDTTKAASSILTSAIDAMRRGREAAQVIEATFAPTNSTFLYAGAGDIAPLEFPLCPDCQHRRYWLGTHGKVVCAVCGVVRFMIIALEFHLVN